MMDSKADSGDNPVAVDHMERAAIIDNELDQKHANYERVDPEVAKYAQQVAVAIDEETNVRLRKLIDRRVLVIMIFTYFLQAIDKGTMSFASIMGIQKDAHLVGQQYNWLTTTIYLAVLVVEYPTNWIIQRVPIAKYLSCNIILWGTTLACHAACKSFPALLTLRTLLGIFEACCQPSFILLSSMWYKRDEQAAVVVFWLMMNGGQQIVGGLLAYAFSNIPAGSALYSWQALFVSYGGFTVCWGVFVLFWMPDSPMKAKCFSEEDKALMVERIRTNQTGLQNKKFRKEQVLEAFTDPQTYAFVIIQICTTLPTSGIGAFQSIIINSLGFSLLNTQLLAMAIGSIIIITMLTAVYLDRKYKQPLIIMMCSIPTSMIGTIIFMTVPNTGPASAKGLLIAYFSILSFWATSALVLSLLTRNVAGQTKKATVVATNFVGWCVGNSVGPQVFLSWNGPRYFIAFSVHLGCYIILLLTMFSLRVYYGQQNKKKELKLAQSGAIRDESLVHSFEDLTDKENNNFFYMR